jgi:hypothetical protein
MTRNGTVRLADVGFAAQLLVWAARQWIRIDHPCAPAARRLGEAFARLGASDALAALDAVLGRLARWACRSLDFRAGGDLTLGRDEQGLIDVIDALQAQPADRSLCRCQGVAADIVASWVAEEHRPAMQAQLAELAMALGSAGLRVSCAAREAHGSHSQCIH